MPLEELEANWKFWVGEIEGKRNVPKIGKVNLFFVSATARADAQKHFGPKSLFTSQKFNVMPGCTFNLTLNNMCPCIHTHEQLLHVFNFLMLYKE